MRFCVFEPSGELKYKNVSELEKTAYAYGSPSGKLLSSAKANMADTILQVEPSSKKDWRLL